MSAYKNKPSPVHMSYADETEEVLKKNRELFGQIQARENLYESEKKAMLKEVDRMYNDLLVKQATLKTDIFTKKDYPMAVFVNPELTQKHDSSILLGSSLKTKTATLVSPNKEYEARLENDLEPAHQTITATLVSPSVAFNTDLQTKTENNLDVKTSLKTDEALLVKTATLTDTALKDVVLTDIKESTLVQSDTQVKEATVLDLKTDVSTNLKTDTKLETETETFVDTKPQLKTQTKLTKQDYKDTFKSVLEADLGRPHVELDSKPEDTYKSQVDVSQEAFVAILSERLMNQVGIDAGYATEDTARTYVATHMDEAISNMTNTVEQEVRELNAEAEKDRQLNIKESLVADRKATAPEEPEKGNKSGVKKEVKPSVVEHPKPKPVVKAKKKPVKTIKLDNSNAQFLKSTNQSHVDMRKADPHGGADMRNKMVWGPQQLNEVSGQRSIENHTHMDDKIAEMLATQDQLFENVNRVRYDGALLKQNKHSLK